MVSLNAIMVDGTGMCGSCRVSVGGEVKFACVDGPDFDGHLVDFKELVLRQRRKAPVKPRGDFGGRQPNGHAAIIMQGHRGHVTLPGYLRQYALTMAQARPET